MLFCGGKELSSDEPIFGIYLIFLKGYSVEAAPLVPMLKLSMKRTALSSSGTRVPPDCF